MDIKAYCQRIGLAPDVELTVSARTLMQLHTAHAMSIPFENFDVHLKGHVDMDKDAIFTKIVHGGRGGYCYEVNGLFCDVLREIGFDVSYLATRPMLGYDAIRPKTHMILLVEIDGQAYVADLGFTGMSLVAAVPLLYDFEFEQFSQVFKFIPREQGDVVLQTKLDGNWASLFSFDLEEQEYIDFQLANYFNCTSPESVCTNKLIAAIYRRDGRVRLLDNVLKVRTSEVNEDIELNSEAEFVAALDDYFGLSFTDEDVSALFAKLSQ